MEMAPEDRAREGIFLAFQYPVEIPGVNNAYFLKAAVNAIRKHRGQEELDAMDFLKLGQTERPSSSSSTKDSSTARSTRAFPAARRNGTRFSRWPCSSRSLAILDETDSGLDIDALKIVANGVNALRSGDRAMIVITHYQRLLNYIIPDFVHVLSGGKIVKSGGKELALELEEKGYGWIEEAVGEISRSG